jgi:hypothetical protein
MGANLKNKAGLPASPFMTEQLNNNSNTTEQVPSVERLKDKSFGVNDGLKAVVFFSLTGKFIQ